MPSTFFRWLAATLSVTFFLPFVNGVSSDPSVTVKNGNYIGKHVPCRQQDQFLGISYAISPVGPLRFARPQSLDFPSQALGMLSSMDPLVMNTPLSEDCLALNVVRPSGTTRKNKLPMLVWIYGCGLYAGATADPKYNLSGITHVGQDIGKPVITAWGFLQTPQLLAEGNLNAGLLDQRLAFRWIKENITAFGGDPNPITIWGESAGAQSIAYHLLSYDGRNDDLFQSAILESGGPTGAQIQPLAYYSAHVENLTRATNCYTSTNQLQCLRSLTSDELYNGRVSTVWNPLIDGDFLTAHPSQLIPHGKFIHIPLLDGAKTDEGSSFGVSGLDNETTILNDLLSYRSYQITPPTARKLLESTRMTLLMECHTTSRILRFSQVKDYSGEEMRLLLETWSWLLGEGSFVNCILKCRWS